MALSLLLLMISLRTVASLVPFRVPATPLWVHSPYINWLMPADNATDDWVWHVRNDKVGSMTAAAVIDGHAWSLLGPMAHQCPSGTPLAMPALQQEGPPLITPTQTRYSFAGSGVRINMTFASPKFIEDLDSFLPVALLELLVVPLDNQKHNVQFFFEMTGQIAVDNDANNVSWGRDTLHLPKDAVSMHIYNPDGNQGPDSAKRMKY